MRTRSEGWLLVGALMVFGCGPMTSSDPDPVEDDPPAQAEPEPEPCTYSEAVGFGALGTTIPPLRWASGEADEGEPLLDLDQMFCDETEARPSSLHFVLTAGWCTACGPLLHSIEEQRAAIEEAGGKVVVVHTEDTFGASVTTSQAVTYVAGYVDSSIGIIVGDGSGEPADSIKSALYDQSTVLGTGFMPVTFVVRTADMKIVAADSEAVFLNHVHIAAHIDDDDPTIGMPEPPPLEADLPPFVNACADGEEEASEPNNDPSLAGSLAVGSHPGGICAEPAQDFYRIDLEGNWEATLEFSQSVGDLDLYVLTDDGLDVLAYSESETDDESVSWSGPALLLVNGWENASSPYMLTIAEP